MAPTNSRIRVYIACSLDGFIAGPDGDLSWLPGSDAQAAPEANPHRRTSDTGAVSFEQFIGDVGALLMGRNTYDMVAGFTGDNPYGERPILVATHRSLDPIKPNVSAVSGHISDMVAIARLAAAGKDVYVDGGEIIRQAIDAGLVDDVIVTIVPTILGAGVPLFAGAANPRRFELIEHHDYEPGMVQLHLRPKGRAVG